MAKKTPKKDESVLDLIKKTYPEHLPSDKEKQVVETIFTRFRDSADERNRNYKYFDGLNLVEYINDSVRRFTTNVDERDGLEDWQARVFDPFTRNKVLAVLGKAMQTLPIAQFKSRGDEHPQKGIILTNIYEYIEDKEDYDETMVHLMLEAIVKGTAIAYEGVDRVTKLIRDVDGVGDDIKVSEIKEEYTCFPTTIVPLEDFYPSSVSIRKIKDMPYCFWRSIIPYSKFKSDFADYKMAQFVVPKFSYLGDTGTEDKPFYFDFISQDVDDGNVELIRYYSQQTDEFIILANGVWINPIKTKEGDEIISPIPFKHKSNPFFEIKYDFFGDWFYGKSLPDKLKSMQDVLNVLTNMLLDQSFLTIFTPILTSGIDSIEDDYLRPGRRTPIDTQGQPLSAAVMKLDMGTPGSWHQYILEYTRRVMEQSSLDQVSSGNAGVGGRTTAKEIQTAAEAVTQIMGVFGTLTKYGIKQKARLKSANILQFGTDQKLPLITKILGKEGSEDFVKYFNVFKINDTYLSNGKRGMKVIEMYADKSEMPDREELKARALISEVETGTNTEIVALPGDYIRSFEYDVEVVPNPKLEHTKDMTKALQLEKVKVYMSFFPQIVDVGELAAQTAVVMGDDPSKLLRQDVINPQPAEGAQMSPMSQTPQANNAENMVKAAAGNESADQNLNILLKGNV